MAETKQDTKQVGKSMCIGGGGAACKGATTSRQLFSHLEKCSMTPSGETREE